MTTQAMDPAKAQAFAGQMVGTLNAAMFTLLISVGNRLGIFDRLAGMPPATSGEIAAATGLNERYIREWLGGMTTGRIVEHDPAKGTYWLPPEHAPVLTHAAGPGNLAPLAEFVAQFGRVEDQIVDCFRNGGGVPYAEYPRFQELMAALSARTNDAALLPVIVPLVPGMRERLEGGIAVADVVCGQGHAINLLAKEFPRSRFTGFDFNEDAIAIGRSEARDLGVSNVRFEQKDVATIDGATKFDFITAFDAIHDQAQPRRVLKGIHESLNPDGMFLMVDVAADSTHAGNMEHPMAAAFYAISTFHCMTVSLALGGEGLGSMWGEQKARELLAEAGFSRVAVEHVEGDIVNAYYVCAK